MSPWPQRPVVYEINAWVWLDELSRHEGRPVRLGTVPVAAWDAIGSMGVDAVWLMGVWERSPAGAQIAREDPALQAEYRRALPGVVPEDVVGSPYCVHRYLVDGRLGGPEGLAAAREMLAERGLRLILDFVPNHVAPDHPWVRNHAEYFVQGNEADLARSPQEFFEAGGRVIACGRDPYFPPWTDTAQINAFSADLRRAAVATLRAIAAQCDGVRCDMAMLLTSDVFERTWGERAGPRPAGEFWEEVIPAVRASHPEFLFIAEAYWDLEWELQRQGFQFCYDKRLYDRLVHDDAESLRRHLGADPAYQEKLIRFVENHDEPRAATTLAPAKGRAAAVAIATLPGAKLYHEGQFEGRRIKLPVQLGRRPEEPHDAELESFCRKLLKAAATPAIREGQWQLCERSGWPDNASFQNLVAWCWRHKNQRCLVVINACDGQSQGRVQVPWNDLAGRPWLLVDALSGDVFARDGTEIRQPGLYVALEPWGFHFLKFESVDL